MKNNSRVQVGGHVSMSGGLAKAVERAAEIGGNTMQIFSGSPRSWRRKDLSKWQPKKMFAKMKELGVKSVFTHALYLVNLASDNDELREKSVRALIYDLQFDSLVQGSGVVVHLGSHQGRGWGAVKEQLVEKIKYILQQTPTDSQLLIENSAGQNGKIASDLAEIRWLLDAVDSPRLGWCLDTCHAFAAGYLLAPTKNNLWEKQARGEVLKEIQELDLAERLKCIHVNDSKVKFNSGTDRHENIGAGEIPEKMLKEFLQADLIAGIPLITEVPGFAGKGPDKENVERIREMALG